MSVVVLSRFCSRYHVVYWKQVFIRCLMWIGKRLIMGAQVWKKLFTLDSFCKLASTQSIRSRKVSFSRKSRWEGRTGPIQVWRIVFRAAAEMQNNSRFDLEGTTISVSCRLPVIAQLGVSAIWQFVWVVAKQWMRPQNSLTEGQPQKQWNKLASPSPHLEQSRCLLMTNWNVRNLGFQRTRPIRALKSTILIFQLCWPCTRTILCILARFRRSGYGSTYYILHLR